ncbi:MAG: hypothetical protein K6A82_07535 [Prevotella sp.]|nr:hypothetical protein [Prevotella sp.]
MKSQRIYRLLAVMLLAFTGWQLAEASPASNGQESPRQQIAVSESHQEQHAVPTDSSQLARLCSSRPERVISVRMGNFKTPGSRQHLFSHNTLTIPHYPDRQLLLTRPIMMMPQSHYYVYRLRHLLC